MHPLSTSIHAYGHRTFTSICLQGDSGSAGWKNHALIANLAGSSASTPKPLRDSYALVTVIDEDGDHRYDETVKTFSDLARIVIKNDARQKKASSKKGKKAKKGKGHKDAGMSQIWVHLAHVFPATFDKGQQDAKFKHLRHYYNVGDNTKIGLHKWDFHRMTFK